MARPLPPEALRARIDGRVPRTLAPAAFADVHCTVLNVGDAVFDSEAPNPVQVAHRWFLDGVTVGAEAARVQIPRLAPGETARVAVPLRTPDEAGTYRLRISLVQEHVAWFDDLDPASALEAQICVVRRRRLSLVGAHSIVQRFPPPDVPWRADYALRHRELVSAVLDDKSLMRRFRSYRRLPRGYGWGFDERVVEYPWLFTHELTPPILDAGSTLNHRHLLERLGASARELTIVTLAPEPESFPDLGVAYVYEDLRALPFPDGSFRTVTCLSTLEHVGMDNRRFGAPSGRSRDPLPDRDRAARELRRVTAPGGTLLITVPFGKPDDLGWLLQLDAAALERLRRCLEPAEWDVRFYAHSRAGWQPAQPAAAAHARFEDHAAEPHATPDRAAAARAVACIWARL